MEIQEHPLEQWRQAEQERREKPFRRYQLAKAIGCSASRLTQIVKLRESPSAALAGRIREVTGISIDVLFDAAKKQPLKEAAE